MKQTNKRSSLAIIIPIYNTEKYLRRCLDTVSKIEYPIHVILVDDGSTDSCGDICDEYVRNDSRFNVIHKKNEGLVEARKTGIDVVKDEYFVFIDSDDYIDSNEYTRMLKEYKFDLSDLDIICMGMTEEYQGNKIVKYNKFQEGEYKNTELNMVYEKMLCFDDFFDFGILPNAVCKIYRTEFIRNNPCSVSSNVRIGEDADMTYQLMLKAKKIGIINAAPYHYLRRDDSMMCEKINYEAIYSLENDLKIAFENIGNKYLIDQLKNYMDFIKLLCAPELILSDLEFFKYPKHRIALYGAGGVGKAVRNRLKNDFALWVDMNAEHYNLDIISPVSALIEDYDKYDKVFIAISNVSICSKIKQNLEKMGIQKPIYYYGMSKEDCL